MTDTRAVGEVKTLWEGFVRGVRSLMGALPEHRHQDQYLKVKEAALALAERQDVANAIDAGYRTAVLKENNVRLPDADAVDVVVMELEGFPLAVQVHEAEEKAGTTKPGAHKRLRAAAKTILGSVKDLFILSDLGKKVITVLEEALDLCGGD